MIKYHIQVINTRDFLFRLRQHWKQTYLLRHGATGTEIFLRTAPKRQSTWKLKKSEDIYVKFSKHKLYQSLSIVIAFNFLQLTNNSNFYFFFVSRVWNVSAIKFNKTIAFKTTEDHSKWAVSDIKNSWICVGDINRAVRIFLASLGHVTFKPKHSSIVLFFFDSAIPNETWRRKCLLSFKSGLK